MKVLSAISRNFVGGVLIPPALSSGHQASNHVPRQASTQQKTRQPQWGVSSTKSKPTHRDMKADSRVCI